MSAERQRGPTGIALRDPLPWHDLEQIVATSEQTGYSAVFLPEIAARDVFATLTGLAPAAPSVTLGTGVATTVSRKARITAMAAATVAERSGGRMLLGLGTGPARKGALEELRAYATTVRVLLNGGAADGERLTLDIPRPVPIWIAALGPRAMRLAGEIADGVLLNWCPPERVAFARERIREGAEAVGRDPGAVRIGVYVRSVVGQGTAGDAGLRKAAAEYASYPAYRRQFEQVGLADEARRAAEGDVPEALLGAVALRGDAESASNRLQAYRDAGADLPVLYPVATLDLVSSILGTVFGLAPAPAVED
ncbi:MAG: LLM class flavin-dependent oxidoreductase [Actinomycetota bacterium]